MTDPRIKKGKVPSKKAAAAPKATPGKRAAAPSKKAAAAPKATPGKRAVAPSKKAAAAPKATPGKRAVAPSAREARTNVPTAHKPTKANFATFLWRFARSVPLPYYAGLAALGIGCYQLSLPHVLTGVLGWSEGYDDGVYAGISLLFVHGVLAYRDFGWAEPPGIAYLLAPFSGIGVLTSSATALVLDRCLTVVTVSANAVLAGMLVRRSGRLSAAVASFSLALWPLAVSVRPEVELEPYLVFFVLLGALVLFGGVDEPSRRRVVIAGVLFGFAVIVKLWAVMPVAAVLLVWLPRWRRDLKWLVVGMVGGVVVPSVPFLVAAPGPFIRDVVLDQLARKNPYAATALGGRLLLILGATGLPAYRAVASASMGAFQLSQWIAGGAFALIVAISLYAYGRNRRRRSKVEWFVLAAAIITFVGMFVSPVLVDHYAYFPAAMLAPLVGLCIGYAREIVFDLRRRGASGQRPRRPLLGLSRRVATRVLPVTVGVAFVVFMVQQDATISADYFSEASAAPPLANYVPAGACIISDFPADLMAAGVFTPSQLGCPVAIDPYSMYLESDDGNPPHLSPPPYPVQFQHLWLSYLQHAQYVELRFPESDFFPWSQYTFAWFSQHYRLIAQFRTVYAKPFIDSYKTSYLYERNG